MFENQMQKSTESSPFNKAKAIYLYLLERNYKMAYNGNIGIFFLTFLFILRQLQILSLISLPKEEQLLQTIPNLSQMFTAVKLFRGEFENTIIIQSGTKMISFWMSVGILCLQAVSFIMCFIPCNSSQINRIFSKFITILSIVLPIPSTHYFSRTLLGYIQNSEEIGQFCISISSFLLMVLNHFIFTNFHFTFSIKQMSRNKMVRFPNSWIKQFGWILFAFLHPFAENYAYPNVFILYSILYLVFGCYQGKCFAVGFEYFDAKVCRNLGILCLLNITLAISMLSCFFGISLFMNGLTSFMIAFYLFFVHFFLTFRKFWIKRIIIDDNTTTQISQITYVTTFIVFLCDISQKKNQTYISSLLKNHCNNCNEVVCCCKNRNTIYDPSTEMMGNSLKQPHLDEVFIKHFYLKMIQDSIIEFQKSINLKMLLCLFYLQFLQLSPLCIKQIQYFNKKSMRDKLSLQQKFALFCLEEQFKSFVDYDNYKKGDKKIENAQLFDHYFNMLIEKIIQITGNLKYFWEVLNNVSQQYQDKEQGKEISESFLSAISTKTIQLMQQIESLYKKMKNINPHSNKFKQMMFYYSKQVINDMDFFLRIKQDLKIEKISHKQKGKQNQGSIRKNFLNIYHQNTANFVIKDINTIKWASNNAKEVFGFRKLSQLQKCNITNLMPPFFGKEHDSNVKNWLQSGKCAKINRTTTIWCKKQNNSCFKALIYIKVMCNFMNPTQKFIEYYTTIEKVGSNEIICGADGQIYGCDQNLKSIMKCSLKFIQTYRPNIQIFFPMISQYFIGFFYKEHLENKRKHDDTFSGYIPSKVAEFIQNITKQKDTLKEKVKNSKNYAQSYAQFIETKMQQITVYLKGDYVTIDVEVYRENVINRELVVIKIIRIENNTIQKYYNQFEKTIKMMKLIKDQSIAKRQVSFKSKRNRNQNIINQMPFNQTNPLDIFFNPKNLRKLNLLKKKNQDPNLMNNQNRLQKQMNPIQKVNIRKQRAINQLEEIKNENTRRVIQKMKKALFENKIFSANTLKILNEDKDEKKEMKNSKESNEFIIEQYSQQQEEQVFEVDAKKSLKRLLTKDRFAFKTDHFDEQDFLLNEDQSGSQNQLNIQRVEKNNRTKRKRCGENRNDPVKQQQQDKDGVSFQQSTTSSAAFISLSTKIKLLKTKLREVKPKPLLILSCITFVSLLIIANILNVVNVLKQKEGFQVKNEDQYSKYSNYRLLQCIMLSKILLVNRENLQKMDNITKQRVWKYQIELEEITKAITISELTKYTYNGNQLYNKSNQKSQINYMQFMLSDKQYKDITNKTYTDKGSISLYDFILKQYTEIIRESPTMSTQQYASTIRKFFSSNEQSYRKQVAVPHVIYLLPFLFVTNIIVVVKLHYSSRKVRCITKLISQLYGQQKRKYKRYYKKISFKMEAILEQMNLNQIINNKAQESQPQNMHISAHSKTSSNQNIQIEQDRQNIMDSRYVLIKIILVFLIIYFSVLAIYLYTHQLRSETQKKQYKFDEIVIGKMAISYRMLLLVNYHHFNLTSLTNNQYNQFQESIDVAPQIIQIYNQGQISESLKSSINKFNIDNICYQLQSSQLFQMFAQSKLTFDQLPVHLSQLCSEISQSLFSKGTIHSIPYIYQYLSYFSPPLPSPSLSILSNLSHTQVLSFLLSYQSLFKSFLAEKCEQNRLIYERWLIIAGIFIIVSLILLIIWGYVYKKITYIESGFNFYLIMLPFEVMIENPYIRHYLKQQLGFKSNLY